MEVYILFERQNIGDLWETVGVFDDWLKCKAAEHESKSMGFHTKIETHTLNGWLPASD